MDSTAAEKQAEELLPQLRGCASFTLSIYRAAVAKALAEKDAEIQRRYRRQIAVCGGCPCGIAYISNVDSIDSGSTYSCEAGHPIVFDVWEPEVRTRHFKIHLTIMDLEAEIDRLKRGQYICSRCLLRKDDEHPKGDF